MSYRDLRYFTEMLRALGYPKLVSMESFRQPNFPLTAEILIWLTKRLDPEADISSAISTEDERVALICATAKFMALKINVKLNTKRLYQSDGYAVKELLKITTLLHDALKNSHLKKADDEPRENILSYREFDISDKINDLKQSRQLATEITLNGAELYDLLGKEVDLRALRHISVARQFEITEVEAGIKSALQGVYDQIEELKQLISNVSSTEASLDTKIERRKVELDRYEKRLQSLKKVKPAFLEEFSKAEHELQELYEQYIVRYRCMIYLEQKFVEVERIETERMQEHLISTRKLVEQLRLEEHLPEENSDTGDAEVDDEKKTAERPKVRAESRSRPLRSSKLYGTMHPDALNEISSGSSSSDSEDVLLDGEEPELAGSVFGSDEDSIALEIASAEKRATTGRKTSTQHRVEDSDDDF